MLIGEVSQRSGVSARMLRHYDALGLVSPIGRTDGGYRDYADADLRRLLHVESLRTLGLSLAEVAQALDDPGFTPVGLVDDLVRRSQERIAVEEELLRRLRRLGATEPAAWDDVLRVVALMRTWDTASPAGRQRTALDVDDAPPVSLLADAVLAEADPHVAGALRWALERAGGDAVAPVAAGLGSSDVEVRRRAVLAVAEIDDPAVPPVLEAALADVDPLVRSRAATALGRRGHDSAVPELVTMVVDGRHDVEAGEALGVLATDPSVADVVVTALLDRLDVDDPAVRRRVTQAVAEVPGEAGRAALAGLTGDDDPVVASTAAHVLRLRGADG